MRGTYVFALTIAAGASVAIGSIDDKRSTNGKGFSRVASMTHMFISASGERVFYDSPVVDRAGEIDLWIQANDPAACPDNNYFAESVWPFCINGCDLDGDGVNDNAFGYTAWRDWGDISGDNVVDVLTTAFATGYVDPTPNDSMFDPVVGNNLNIRFEDAQGGGSNPLNGGSIVLTTIQIPDLPSGSGGVIDSATGDGFTVTVELGADASFEIGDTNGMAEEDCVGSRFNANSFTDLDGDSLHDFSFDLYFDQPGVDPQDPATFSNAVLQGSVLSYPDPVLAASGGPFPPPGATGAQDVFSSFDLRDTSGADLFDEADVAYGGSWFYGGFVCLDDPGTAGVNEATPWGGFEMQLFGPTPGTCGAGGGGCNAADLAEPFGQLTFGDIGAFLAAFDAMEPAADLAEPFGQFTFGDIGAFLAAFDAGCP